MLTIRRANVSDEDAIFELWNQLIHYHQSIEAFRPERWKRAPGEVIRPLLSAAWQHPQQQAIFVAEREGQLVGFVLTQLKETGHCPANIDALAVDEGDRGRGAGHALLDAAVSWCQANAAHEISLDCIWPNHQARRFYEKRGFRPLLVTYVLKPDRPKAD